MFTGALVTGVLVHLLDMLSFISGKRGLMRRKRTLKKKIGNRAVALSHAEEALNWHSELARIKRHIDKLWEIAEQHEERLQDIEIHCNLLTRLLTTICVEKFGMRIGVLKRLIKRIEKEAIRDSQILHLESLYKLPHHAEKKGPVPPASEKKDPWEEIS